MYDLGDMGGSFDAKKISDSQQTPTLPKHNYNGKLLLKGVSQEEGDKSGKRYDFVFECTASSADQLFVGGTYVCKFYHGASKMDREKCWKKLTPLLVALAGGSMQDPTAVAAAPTTLGDCLAATKKSKDSNTKPALDLPVGIGREMEEARPDLKTGLVDPKFIDPKTGKPQWFARDTWTVV